MTAHEAAESASAQTPGLPSWAMVGQSRWHHIERVVLLLSEWAARLELSAREVSVWRDAGLYHDALRDAPEIVLRSIVPQSPLPYSLLHGPAAAKKLEDCGDVHPDVIEAVRYHTTGRANWCATGRALYCADYLEPGRSYLTSVDHELRTRYTAEPDRVFAHVMAQRLARAINRTTEVHPLTVEMWNEFVRQTRVAQ